MDTSYTEEGFMYSMFEEVTKITQLSDELIQTCDDVFRRFLDKDISEVDALKELGLKFCQFLPDQDYIDDIQHENPFYYYWSIRPLLTFSSIVGKILGSSKDCFQGESLLHLEFLRPYVEKLLEKDSIKYKSLDFLVSSEAFEVLNNTYLRGKDENAE